MSIFKKMMKKYDEELERLTYNVAFVSACELLREIAKKVAQDKAVTDQLLDGMYITFYDESEEDARWMYVGYIEGEEIDGLDIVKGINLAKLEATLPAVLEEIAAEKAAVVDSITVAE